MKILMTPIAVFLPCLLFAQTESLAPFEARLDKIPSITLKGTKTDYLSFYSFLFKGKNRGTFISRFGLERGKCLAQMPIVVPQNIGDDKMILTPNDAVDYKLKIIKAP